MSASIRGTGNDPSRAALERLIRQGVATGQLKTIVVEVRERHGRWLISIPDVAGVQASARQRNEIQTVARALVASTLQVPAHFFDLHLRFPD